MTNPKKRPLSFAFAASLLALVALPVIGGATAAGASTPAGSSGVGTPSISFEPTTVGDILGPQTFQFDGSTTVTGFAIGGADPDDFTESAGSCTFPLAPGTPCEVDLYFVPGELGPRTASLIPLDGATDEPSVATLLGTGSEGYYEVTAQGAVAAHGDALSLGDESGTRLTQPIVASATTGDDAGYWLAAADGGIFSFGDAGFFGSTGAIHLNKPIVGMASTIDAEGYWLVASDGGIFSFGDAQFFGSTGAIHLNQPIVGMAATPDDEGYWLVASDGGIFSFGDAAVLRLDRGHPSQQAHRRHGVHTRRTGVLARRLRWRHLQLRRRPVLRLHRGHPSQQADRQHGGHARRRRLLAHGFGRRALHLR